MRCYAHHIDTYLKGKVCSTALVQDVAIFKCSRSWTKSLGSNFKTDDNGLFEKSKIITISIIFQKYHERIVYIQKISPVKNVAGRDRKSNTLAHLNRDQIESTMSVPGIKGCHENALYNSFETSPYLISLCASTNIPLGPALIHTWSRGWPYRDLDASLLTYQVGARF